jgi:hypothetical protein
MADKSDDQAAFNDNSAPSTGKKTEEQRVSSNKSDDGTSGQPIGGNDSNSGTGTTLTQGADLGPESDPHEGGSNHGEMGRHAGEAAIGNRSNLQDISDIGPTESYGGGIEGRQSHTEGEGFILQQGSGTDDLRQRKAQSLEKKADKQSAND